MEGGRTPASLRVAVPPPERKTGGGKWLVGVMSYKRCSRDNADHTSTDILEGQFHASRQKIWYFCFILAFCWCLSEEGLNIVNFEELFIGTVNLTKTNLWRDRQHFVIHGQGVT